jgi:peptide/nickel transport system permease protein
MLFYIFKRILLIIPTFLAISLIVFAIVNFAPGNPGGRQIGSEGGQQANTGEQRESYRIFKEQFNLDKPVLLNFRYGLTQEEVVDVLAKVLNPEEDKNGKKEKKYSLGEQIESQEYMENLGRYAVPSLIEILNTHPQKEFRALASQRLTINARKRLEGEFRKDLTKEQREINKKISDETQSFKEQYFLSISPEEQEEADTKSKTEEEVKKFWNEWYTSSKSDWEYSAGDKFSIILFDTRFAKYWYNLSQLNFGVSHRDKRPVLETVLSKLKYSLTLAVTSVFLAYLISLPLGIWSAVNHNSKADRGVTIVLFMLYSLPSFFVGVVLLNLLTVEYKIFPTAGFESLNASEMTTLEYIKDVMWHVFLPICCMTYASLAALSRYAKTGLLDIINADFIRTARAKGLPEGVVIIKHAARNGMIPILTLIATLLPVLIGGSVVIEQIFGIPGMGRYGFEAILTRDYNVVMAILLISSLLTLIGMLISDILYAVVDPRITFD